MTIHVSVPRTTWPEPRFSIQLILDIEASALSGSSGLSMQNSLQLNGRLLIVANAQRLSSSSALNLVKKRLAPSDQRCKAESKQFLPRQSLVQNSLRLGMLQLSSKPSGTAFTALTAFSSAHAPSCMKRLFWNTPEQLQPQSAKKMPQTERFSVHSFETLRKKLKPKLSVLDTRVQLMSLEGGVPRVSREALLK